MSGQDPLRKSRLGLRGLLLVSGAVLVGSSIFLLDNSEVFDGSTPTTSLSGPLTTAPSATSGVTGATGATPNGQGQQTAGPALVPVYWLGDVNGTDKLFREFRTPLNGSTADPIADAVRTMTRETPLDPDYRTPWEPASAVSSSVSTKNVITLDISADAFPARLDADEADLALQQLVYTATAAAANAGLIAGGESSSVVVLVDGAADYRAFNAVDLTGERTRDTSSLAPVWIIDPQDGITTGSVVNIRGVGPSTEESLDWRIDGITPEDTSGATESTDTPVRDGSVPITPEDGVPGAYSFTVSLPPGHYRITLATHDGAGDTKTVHVE